MHRSTGVFGFAKRVMPIRQSLIDANPQPAKSYSRGVAAKTREQLLQEVWDNLSPGLKKASYCKWLLKQGATTKEAALISGLGYGTANNLHNFVTHRNLELMNAEEYGGC